MTATITRARLVAAATLLLVALSGCGNDDSGKPAAAPPTSASPSPSPSPTVDDRATCRLVAQLGNAFEFDPTKNQQAGAQAALSPNPGIARAGAKLVEASAASDGQPGDGNLGVAQAQLEVAEACASLFGDGQW